MRVERHRDGLTTAGMEIGGFGAWYVNTFMDADDVMSESFRSRGVEGTGRAGDAGRRVDRHRDRR